MGARFLTGEDIDIVIDRASQVGIVEPIGCTML